MTYKKAVKFLKNVITYPLKPDCENKYPNYWRAKFNEVLHLLDEQAEVLRILKENADTSVERTNFIDGEEYEYTATVIEIANDGGIDYKTIKAWLEGKE